VRNDEKQSPKQLEEGDHRPGQSLLREGGKHGGLYEFVVLDPVWPCRPDLIRPNRGGISRKRFWIPAHKTFELVLIAALMMACSLADVSFWLLVAPGPWSILFRRLLPLSAPISRCSAQLGASKLLASLPLDIVTCASMLAALQAC
jgi:hypothetical protein